MRAILGQMIIHRPDLAIPPPIPPMPPEPPVDTGLLSEDSEEFKARTAACLPCEYHDAGEKTGIERCNAPGCACSRLDQRIVAFRCVHPKGSRWPQNQFVKPSPKE